MQIDKQIIFKALRDPIFGKETLQSYPLTAFNDNPHYKDIVAVVRGHYRTSNMPLDKATLMTLLEDKLAKSGKSLVAIEEYYQTVDDLYILEELDMDEDTIDSKIEEHIRTVLGVQVIQKAIAGGKAIGDEATLNNLLEDLRQVSVLKVGGDRRGALDFFNDVERKKEGYRKINVSKYRTGFDGIDLQAEGGIGKGEMGLVIAPTGKGKTMILVNLANNYVKQGLNVLVVGLEEAEERISLRFEQSLARMTKANIMPNNKVSDLMIDRLHEAYAVKHKNEGWGQLYIEEALPQTVTPLMLEQMVVELQVEKGIGIDVVLIDYPDLMKNPHANLSESDAGGKLYEDLRALAKKHDYICWVASQTNRSGYQEETLTVASIEGSKRKTNACELIFTVNQYSEEFDAGFIRFWLDKVRNRTDGKFEQMIKLKVVGNQMLIRNQTEQERQEHELLLAQKQEDSGNSYKKDKAVTPLDKAMEVNSINEQMGGMAR